MTEQVASAIREAQLVLIGIGEEFDAKRSLKKNEEFLRVTEGIRNEWLLPYIEKYFLTFLSAEYVEIYRKLADCLQQKNYFVISLCQDGMIRQVGLDETRITEPCGTYEKMQCAEVCHKELHDIPDGFMEQIELLVKGKIQEEDLEQPVCPVCGKPLVFNRVETENYIEEGYLENWQKYRLWLQGTVNKKLCVLELGVGMKYPTVIRWPFEKVVFFNQKSVLYRVHSKLFQMTEELKERGYGICSSPIEFLKELQKHF